MSKKTQTSLIDFQSEEFASGEIIRKLKLELMMLKRMGIEKVKIAHGQGNSKDGDNISNIVRAELLEQARDEKINGFAPGEVFGPFEKEGKQLVEIDPSFRDDEDWSKSNSMVTLVSL